MFKIKLSCRGIYAALRGWKKGMRFTAILVSSMAVSLASYTPTTGQEVNFDAIAALPGAKITTTMNKDGSEFTEVKLPNGVVFDRERRNGRTWTAGSDLSGHGAVWCSWEIYVAMTAALESCAEYRNEPVRADLADAIDKINDFIVANSLSPISKADLERRAASWRRQDPLLLCRPDSSYAEMFKSFSSISHDKLMNSVADLLSVPRPPVMNPCL